MQVVFQDPFGSLSPRMCVADIVGEGLRIHRIGSPAEQEAAIIAALEEVGLDPAPDTATHTNSPAANANASPSPARWC